MLTLATPDTARIACSHIEIIREEVYPAHWARDERPGAAPFKSLPFRKGI